MKNARGKHVALGSVIAGAVVLAVLLVVLLARGDLSAWFAGQDGHPPLPRAPGAQKVVVAPGTIQLREFAGFLQDYTGLQVLLDSEVSRAPIHVATAVENADAEMVRSLLEANEYSVYQDKLPDGRQILRIQKRAR
jgi:hypothetical protein